MRLHLGVALLCLGTFCLVYGHETSHTGVQWASVYLDLSKGSFRLHRGPVENNYWVAKASFTNAINTTGWAYLEVTTNGNYEDGDQAYSAGLLEGSLTTELIDLHWRNTLQAYCVNETAYCDRLKTFLRTNMGYLNKNIVANPNDPYWHQVSLVLKQVSGIEDGHSGRSRQPRTRLDVFGDILINMMGDLEDLEQVLQRTSIKKVVGSGSCSGLVKLLADNQDVYFSHDTWTVYSQMIKILKKYTFPFRTSPTRGAETIPGHTVSFSSYPGMVFSGDDFYALSSGLAVMETTNSNGNTTLWKYITPQSVFDWTRNIVANRLASTGESWTEWFGKHNSGTYNNQFMVLDYKLFKPGQSPPDGMLWVLEQLPGYIQSADVTPVLRNQTYWASYNTPYFPLIFNLSGGPENVAKYGDWFDYNKTPRAQIFRRDHSKVRDMTSMMRLMRYNDFQHDPLSRCNCTPPYSAENAISARCDLNDPHGVYPFGALGHRSHGATDMKLTNSSLFSRLEFVAISGPAHDPLPPFQWSTSGLPDPHEGHPDIWQFGPVLNLWNEQNQAQNQDGVQSNII